MMTKSSLAPADPDVYKTNTFLRWIGSSLIVIAEPPSSLNERLGLIEIDSPFLCVSWFAEYVLPYKSEHW